MAIMKIDAVMLQKAFLAGAQCIDSKKEYINQLNVFPVPDGDTGTNMTLTIMSAAKEVSAIEKPTMENLSKAISSGSLRGARGNSGVILSQLFRGFCRGIANKEALTTEDLAICFEQAVATAYKAVMKPKEGTILTVAKGMSDKANEIYRRVKDIEEFGRIVIEYGNEVLAYTPELLPVLKEAGVVDSGGQGLMEVLQGAYQAVIGKEVEISNIAPEPAQKFEFTVEDDPNAEITFGYCTEFIIMLEQEYNDETEAEFKEYLSSIGDSLVVVSDDDIVKVHVHTNHPGLAFEKGLTYGSLTRMKIDNMREEHQEKLAKAAGQKTANSDTVTEKNTVAATENGAPAKKKEPAKDFGFIAVSIGEGINEIFNGLGVDYLIEGGQTMNPSTEDMLNAIEQVNANTIFILPNNKNIILAAQQAQSLTEDKEIVVIPSKTVPQGISAIIAFDPSQTTEDNTAGMTEAMTYVKTGQVTYAVRDTSIDGKTINTGDIMGIGDDGIKSVNSDVFKTTMELVDELVDDDTELICLYYGEDVQEDDANAILDAIEKKYKSCDVELHYGGQPIYYYLISVE
ncbi:MAG: DAK2 domain-containing protein [Lachnospiraceae bacterium]|nr:DAK2 domain-containing protein [Lachnospiraceae bacterium]